MEYWAHLPIIALDNRSGDELVNQLLLASPEACAEKLSKLQSAGVQRVFLWPLTDEISQLEMFQKRVALLVL